MKPTHALIETLNGLAALTQRSTQLGNQVDLIHQHVKELTHQFDALSHMATYQSQLKGELDTKMRAMQTLLLSSLTTSACEFYPA